jgi:hypothetical protein
MMAQSMLDHALDYARRGVPVFPCKPDKSPHTFSGVKDASTSEIKIRQWWGPGQAPHAMIGMAMGKVSGIWALDPDAAEGDKPDGRANWRALVAENGGCPHTHTHNTPGGGQHLLFKYDHDRPITNRMGDLKGLGIHVRGDGGYIIAPPSVNADGRAYQIDEPLDFWKFAPAPDWLYDKILAKPALPATDSPPLIPTDDELSITERALAKVNANVVQFKDSNRNERTYSETALNRECDALTAEREGGRNDALNSAAVKLGSLIGPGRLSETEVRARLEAAATTNGLVDDDGRRATLNTINSGLSKGLQQPRIIPDRGVAQAKPTESATALAKPVTIAATPYVWKPASAIPRREWLYGTHLIRKFASATIAPGGVGKSSVILTDAIAMATGRDLIGIKPSQRCRVWCWNGEDPTDEMDRRIAAICMQYEIKQEELEGWLFTDSGRDQEIIIASQTRDGAMIAQPVAAALIETIRANAIDVLSIDPFISSHRVTENDNNAIDLVAKEWARIADITNCAIDLSHHTRKTNGAEATVEDGRGAGALIAAVRSARVLNVMSKQEAEKAGIVGHRSYFKMENGKANLAPPPDGADWFQIKSVLLGNGEINDPFGSGDNVGVVTKWKWPDALEGVTGTDFEKAATAIRSGQWRENIQAKDWVGHAVGRALDLDVMEKAPKAKVNGIVKAWLRAGTLKAVDGLDDKREKRKFVEVSEDA